MGASFSWRQPIPAQQDTPVCGPMCSCARCSPPWGVLCTCRTPLPWAASKESVGSDRTTQTGTRKKGIQEVTAGTCSEELRNMLLGPVVSWRLTGCLWGSWGVSWIPVSWSGLPRAKLTGQVPTCQRSGRSSLPRGLDLCGYRESVLCLQPDGHGRRVWARGRAAQIGGRGSRLGRVPAD